MAQITYANKVALNENPNINAINKVRDVDMNELKEVINENETKILLAVTDTEPAECSTGDMYYNTTDELIYTATATDTWSSTGVAPTENTLYVVLTTQTSYMYDGNTLVSIGGGTGSSDIVMVDPDTPTADTKLYIESTDLDFQGLEISNEYTTGDNVAYSADYVNGIIESGNNTNGNYVKYADGTMICYGNISFSKQCNNALTNGGYRNGYGDVSLLTFPQTFTTTPMVSITPTSTNCIGASVNIVDGTNFNVYFVTQNNESTASTKTATYIAIGKWK